MIFAPTPYTHPDPVVRDERAAEAERIAAYWLKRGFPVFSPIAYTHHLAVKYSLPKDAKFWQPMNQQWLRASHEVWLHDMAGWKDSVGVADEIRQAQAWNIPVLLRGVP